MMTLPTNPERSLKRSVRKTVKSRSISLRLFCCLRDEKAAAVGGTEVKSQAGSVLRDTDEITGFPVTLTRQRVVESPTPYKVNSRKLPQKPRADDIRPHGYNIR